jgi:hypothetical protein
MQINLNTLSITLLILFLLTFGLCGWLIYKLIDQSVTIDHSYQQLKSAEKQRKVLFDLLEQTTLENISESEIDELLKTTWNQSTNFRKQKDQLIIDNVSFFFKDGNLIKIEIE